jgi:hypothetical protein
MHSMPAVFTMPMRVRPARLRWITGLLGLILYFFIVPSAKPDSVRCLSRLPDYGPLPSVHEDNILTVTHSSWQVINHNLCFVLTVTPWWERLDRNLSGHNESRD